MGVRGGGGIPIFTAVNAAFSAKNEAEVLIPTPEAYVRNAQWLCAIPAFAFALCLFINVEEGEREERARAGGGARANLPCGLVLQIDGKLRGGVRVLRRPQGAREGGEAVAGKPG